MATAGMLAALAVGLLAAAVSGVPDAMKVARGLVPEEGAAAGGVGVAGGEGAGQQRKGARILAAETLAYHAPLPNYLDHIPCRQALATSSQHCSLLSLFSVPWFLGCSSFLLTARSCSLTSHFSSLLASHFSAPLASHSSALPASHFSTPLTSHLSALLGSHLSAPLASYSSALPSSDFSDPLTSHLSSLLGSQFLFTLPLILLLPLARISVPPPTPFLL
ncbi:unnamed protein product [Closterium sp. NIES-53]